MAMLIYKDARLDHLIGAAMGMEESSFTDFFFLRAVPSQPSKFLKAVPWKDPLCILPFVLHLDANDVLHSMLKLAPPIASQLSFDR